MDRVGAICGKDREMLFEFSRRSLERARAHAPLSRVLSFFSSYLDANVEKEVDKDRLIIEEAARAFLAGRAACELDLEDLFEKTKKVDALFLEGRLVPSFVVSVRYSDIADVRIRRIWRMAKAVYALLKQWPEAGSFDEAVRAAYSAEAFRSVIAEILHLYGLETRMLGDVIRAPFHTALRDYLENVFQAMEETKDELARTYAKQLFGE